MTLLCAYEKIGDAVLHNDVELVSSLPHIENEILWTIARASSASKGVTLIASEAVEKRRAKIFSDPDDR